MACHVASSAPSSGDAVKVGLCLFLDPRVRTYSGRSLDHLPTNELQVVERGTAHCTYGPWDLEHIAL